MLRNKKCGKQNLQIQGVFNTYFPWLVNVVLRGTEVEEWGGREKWGDRNARQGKEEEDRANDNIVCAD